MITEIAFTGTPVTDMPRAREFYEGILGLKAATVGAGGMWVEYELGASTFGIGCYGEVWKPAKEGTVIAFEVSDIEEDVAKYKAKGVPFTLEKTESPVCWFAMIADPDGNQIMIHKRKAAH